MKRNRQGLVIALFLITIAALPQYLLAQQVEKSPSQTIKREIKVVDNLKKITPIKITSHKDGQSVYGDNVQILGTGRPGLKINVKLYSWYTYTEKKTTWEKLASVAFKASTLPLPGDLASKELFKKGVKTSNPLYQQYDVTIDNNGKWYVPAFSSLNGAFRIKTMPFAWEITATCIDPNYRSENPATRIYIKTF